ncbi:hypothetical protein [Aridibaculum aurantiacum]|uniref:hypothetical protein n=1 Tax=Aridibaculum aurantiacum TaxID=2810307 RepID=UPI001A963470|nr:hypothetical protein [Aridibaculum aurantiacum]
MYRIVILLLVSMQTFTTNAATTTSVALDVTPTTISSNDQHRSLVQRLFDLFKKKNNSQDVERANRKAGTSVVLGVFALVSLGVMFLLPLAGFASLPLGILAITTGTSAIREGATDVRNARMGRTLGTISLILCGVAIVLLLAVIAAYGNS